MKTFLFLLLCGMTFCLPFKKKPASTETATPALPVTALATEGAPAPVTDTINFTAQIQPILKTRCNPCHFPGGKMYEKMPFDQAKTILEHPEGVLKRFKDEKEKSLVKAFLEQ